MFCLVSPHLSNERENKGAAIYFHCVFILSADFSDSFLASFFVVSPLPRYLHDGRERASTSL